MYALKYWLIWYIAKLPLLGANRQVVVSGWVWNSKAARNLGIMRFLLGIASGNSRHVIHTFVINHKFLIEIKQRK